MGRMKEQDMERQQAEQPQGEHLFLANIKVLNVKGLTRDEALEAILKAESFYNCCGTHRIHIDIPGGYKT